MADFTFDDQWLKNMQDFTVHHAKQITRCETDAEMDNNSLWELVDEVLNFVLGDENLPVMDAFKM